MSSAIVKQPEKMKFAPLRSVSDFLLDTKRYLPPTLNDLKRFNNRVCSNLLYYQTNYSVISAIIFLLTLLFSFNRLFAGVFGVATSGATILFALGRVPNAVAKDLRTKYPFSIYGAVAINLIVLFITFRSILFLALVVLVPILFWILHASMRSRGIKNKVGNTMEQLGAPVYSNTPMHIVLTAIGLETRDLDE